MTQNDSDAILKWFLTENQGKSLCKQNKRLRDNFKRLARALTLEMTKMPLGAKLTQNGSNVLFEMDFDMKLKQGLIQTN
jgi:hypothetical protein